MPDSIRLTSLIAFAICSLAGAQITKPGPSGQPSLTPTPTSLPTTVPTQVPTLTVTPSPTPSLGSECKTDCKEFERQSETYSKLCATAQSKISIVEKEVHDLWWDFVNWYPRDPNKQVKDEKACRTALNEANRALEMWNRISREAGQLPEIFRKVNQCNSVAPKGCSDAFDKVNETRSELAQTLSAISRFYFDDRPNAVCKDVDRASPEFKRLTDNLAQACANGDCELLDVVIDNSVGNIGPMALQAILNRFRQNWQTLPGLYDTYGPRSDSASERAESWAILGCLIPKLGNTQNGVVRTILDNYFLPILAELCRASQVYKDPPLVRQILISKAIEFAQRLERLNAGLCWAGIPSGTTAIMTTILIPYLNSILDSGKYCERIRPPKPFELPWPLNGGQTR